MKDGRKEIYEKAQLSDEKYKELLEYSNKIGINFFTSIFNKDAAIRINKIQNDIIKIPSTESRNYDLIDYCNNNFNKVIISTGTSSEEELENLKKNLKKDKLTTRDSRVVERKKYGHRKARRSFQFSKR